MPQIPFVGQSYKDFPVSAQDTVNMIPEVLGDPQAKAQYVLKRAPGTILLATPTTLGIGRGVYVPPVYRTAAWENPKAYFVAGNTLYTTDIDGTIVTVGTLLTASGTVHFADNALWNGNQTLLLTDGDYAYYVDMLADNAVTRITDTNFTSVIGYPGHVVFNDGYFLVMDARSQNFQQSPSYYTGAEAWDATEYEVVQTSPDLNRAMVVLNDQIWVFGTESYQIYINTGKTTGSAYDFMGGTGHTIGTAAPESVACDGRRIFWLGGRGAAENKILVNEGYDYRVISDGPLEDEIAGYADKMDAIAYCHSANGCPTYQITFPTSGKTWCYDINSGEWYRKTWFNNGVHYRHRSLYGESFNGWEICQDWETGLIYRYDKNTYTDNGGTIRCERVGPTAPRDRTLLSYAQFELLCEIGQGLATGTGSDPKVMLQISNDGGRTYGSELWESLGVSGDYQQRVTWNMLGQSRDRVWKVAVTDPIDFMIYGANALGRPVG